jgi:uncharacterized protein with NRDE domain
VCFVLALFQVNPRYPLIVAANRDESRSRPSTGPHRWPGTGIWAGRDDVAGGTWLGVNESGLVVAITNRAGEHVDPALPSRGQLCLAALRQPSLAAARGTVEADLSVRSYNAFNLVCVTPTEAWATTWRRRSRSLSAGVHIITNHGDADDRTDPTAARALEMLSGLNLEDDNLDSLLSELGQLCSDTRGPAPICKSDGERGTVSSSLIALGEHGTVAAYRHADGPPNLNPYRAIELLAGDVK